MSTLPIAIANPKAEAKTRTRKTHKFLKHFHFCGTLTLQTIASSLLITVLLWLFARLPDPQVHVTGFRIEALNKSELPSPDLSTIINYNFTIHNPDLYKTLHYIVLFMRMYYSGNYTEYGAVVDFGAGEKGLTQRPGKTDVLGKHTYDYSNQNLGLVSDQLFYLKTYPEDYIHLTFVMETRVMAFNTIVASRQLTKMAAIYFDKGGNAIIDHPGGLAFR